MNPIDLSKLTPLPVFVDDDDFYEQQEGFNAKVLHPEEEVYAAHFFQKEDAEFYALARNAFDVMMRRGWTVERTNSRTWCLPFSLRWVADGKLWDALSGKCFPDPFTALVEADLWYAENVEKASKT